MSRSKVKGQGHQGQRLALPSPPPLPVAYEWYTLAANSEQRASNGIQFCLRNRMYGHSVLCIITQLLLVRITDNSLVAKKRTSWLRLVKMCQVFHKTLHRCIYCPVVSAILFGSIAVDAASCYRRGSVLCRPVLSILYSHGNPVGRMGIGNPLILIPMHTSSLMNAFI